MFTSATRSGRGTARRSIADGASILDYIKDTAREYGIDEQIRFHHRVVGADWSTDDARWTSPPSAPTPARPSSSPAASCSPAAATTATTRATSPTSRHGPLHRAGRAPAALARGPRLRRQEGRRDRQRRHRGHAGPGDGRDRRARHDAAALARPTSSRCRPGYDPWDQRLCAVPDGDLFKAIASGEASVVTDHIDTFTETGHPAEVGRGARGRHHRHRHRPRAAVLGGIELSVDGEPRRPPSS
jgi:cation diffusion facilitator CzcD-associated flavoprotein CzcO